MKPVCLRSSKYGLVSMLHENEAYEIRERCIAKLVVIDKQK